MPIYEETPIGQLSIEKRIMNGIYCNKYTKVHKFTMISEVGNGGEGEQREKDGQRLRGRDSRY